MGRIEAIKTFFQRKDRITPEGGRTVDMSELKGLSSNDREELGNLAAKELGVTLDSK